jgi:hypothetical protein
VGLGVLPLSALQAASTQKDRRGFAEAKTALPFSVPEKPLSVCTPWSRRWAGLLAQCKQPNPKQGNQVMKIELTFLGKPVPSPANVRKTGAGVGIEELAASIAAHGLLQNMRVRAGKSGKFEVVAGGRSL